MTEYNQVHTILLLPSYNLASELCYFQSKNLKLIKIKRKWPLLLTLAFFGQVVSSLIKATYLIN